VHKNNYRKNMGDLLTYGDTKIYIKDIFLCVCCMELAPDTIP
jgi:hypothetical protein